MHRTWLIVVGVVLVIAGLAAYLLLGKLKPLQSGVQIETSPKATVYIDGEQVGTTPYEAVREPGDVVVRLVPDATDNNLSPWDTKLTLTQGIKTVVRRDFGETEDLSAGEVLSFEKLGGNESSLAIVSSPDSVEVEVDGEVKGFTPLALETITVGDHRIRVNQTGYTNREIQARTESGYKLTVIAKLAQSAQAEASISGEVAGSSDEPLQESVEILDTPTGFLRVRSKPSTSGSEVGQVKPGSKFVLLEESKDGDWYKIEYAKDKEGWVSAQYAKKVEKKG